MIGPAFTYLQFHLFWTLPEFFLLLLVFKFKKSTTPLAKLILLNMFLAFVYTTPWDNYLVASGIWTYPPDLVIGRIGYVPLEEYFFFLIQAAMTTTLGCLFIFRARVSAKEKPTRIFGFAIGLLAWLISLLLFLRAGETRYLGLILIWSLPVCILQWSIGGGFLWANGRKVIALILIPTFYLSIADSWAIAHGIWSVSTSSSTGIFIIPNLPLEEFVFFVMTNAMLAFSIVLVQQTELAARYNLASKLRLR